MARRSPVQSNHVLSARQSLESAVTNPSEEPAWKQRAVERSIKTAKLRAAQRVQRFLDAAQAIIIEKGSTDFTVQEVVDRSRQSLRSFYLQFDGKHELLLALFEDALSRSSDQIRAATANHTDPIELMEAASDAGELRTGVNPKRMAAMTMQTVMFIAQSSGGSDEATVHPITADEVWDFCSRGFIGK